MANHNLDNFDIILAPTLALANENGPYEATVEAEYGAACVEGTMVTLAHHGERSGNPAPCNAEVEPLKGGKILLSHVDLDAIGGVMAVAGIKPEDPAFWQAAEFIDVNGPHHIHELPQKEQDKLNAFYAFESENRPRYPRDQISDVKADIEAKAAVLEAVLDERHPEHVQRIAEGASWEAKVTGAVESCLRQESDKVRTFSTPGVFCSSTYYSPNKEAIIPCTAVYNQKLQAVTLAFADGGKEISAEKVMQEIFGPEAGGRGGIAGTPRGVAFTEQDAMQVTKYVEAEYLSLEARGKDGSIIDLAKNAEANKIKGDVISEVRRSNPYFAEKGLADPAKTADDKKNLR